MAELRQIAEAVEAEKRGVLSNDRRAALQEIRNRAAGSKKTLINYIEPLLAIGSAAIAEPVSGFVGMAGLPFGVDAASSAIKRTQDAMTYQPRTQGGKEVMQDIGNLIAPVVEPLQRGAEWMGDTTLDVTGSPALATAVRTGLEVAPDMVGGRILSNIPGRKLEAGDLAASGGQMGRQRGTFAGVRAQNADMDALSSAQDMASRGVNRDEIWSQTGWFNDSDGNWKFEIDDSGYSFPENGIETLQRTGARKQGDIVNHDELFSNYPDAKGITTVESGGGSLGSYNTMDDSIYIDGGLLENATDGNNFSGNALSEVESTNLHEVQHAIQGRESFAEGGNVSTIARELAVRKDRALSNISALNIEIKRLAKEMDDAQLNSPELEAEYLALLDERNRYVSDAQIDIDEESFRQYERLSGEAEARNVETRRSMSAEERRATPPWKTLDVPEDELIIKNSSGGTMEGNQ